jgi:hypothetical protein
VSATWYVNGQRLDQLGFTPTPAPAGRRTGLSISRPGLTLPGQAGEVFAGVARTARAREIGIPGLVRGTSLTDALDKARKLIALCGRGIVTLRCVDATDRVIEAELIGDTIVEAAQPALSTHTKWVSVTLRFTCADPYWRDLLPQTLLLGQVAVACPLGYGAPTPWTLEIFGSEAGTVTDPQVLYKDAGGNTVASLTLTGTLNWATDTTARYRLTTEGLAPRIQKMVAGVWTDADSALTAGSFFMLSPHDGDPVSALYPTMQLYDAGGLATGLLTYHRRHEL